ncbi:MAG: MurR/RpiR family transcriptional regulator [Desulfosporosinus sp.]|nr:MurR/RpiR family transcriptional regulator [Desulfosporosinus sp.]
MDEMQKVIQLHYQRLTKTQKIIAEKVMQQPQRYFMLHIAECATSLGVSEASLTRFARAIDFKGYNELKSFCQINLLKSLGIKEKIIRSLQEPSGGSELIKAQLLKEQDNFSAQMDNIDYKALERLAQLIASANTVYIAGLGVAKTLVEFLKFRLRRLGVDVRVLREGGYEFAENLTLLKREDMVVVIGFLRIYEEILTAIDYAIKVDCPVFAITESHLSKLAVSAHDYVVVRRGPDESLNSVAFPIAVCNAIAITVAHLKEQEVTSTVDNLEWLNMQMKKNFGGEN